MFVGVKENAWVVGRDRCKQETRIPILLFHAGQTRLDQTECHGECAEKGIAHTAL